jgi:indolepyruvate ferredoxin oxidoreductase
VNNHEIVTGDFTRNTEFRIPHDQLMLSLEARLKERVAFFDASNLARDMLGDSIYSNMMVFGAAWQMGYVPVTRDAIVAAITLNGAKIDLNIRAFDLGRWAVVFPDQAQAAIHADGITSPKTLDEKIAYRVDHLRAYQGKGLAKKYLRRLDKISDPEIKEAVAISYHKLLTYKDEYEVARLHLSTIEKASEQFDNIGDMSFHLAPPLLSKMGANGRPIKKTYGPSMLKLFKVLAALKPLRGTPFDVFGYHAERKSERQLIRDFEADLEWCLARLGDATRGPILDLLRLPQTIRGFGPVKMAAIAKAAETRSMLKKRIASAETSGAPKSGPSVAAR